MSSPSFGLVEREKRRRVSPNFTIFLSLFKTLLPRPTGNGEEEVEETDMEKRNLGTRDGEMKFLIILSSCRVNINLTSS